MLEIDALEGDDTIDVLSTAPGVATRVIGGLGNDTINVAGDVTGDVFSLDIEGTSGTVNHRCRSTDSGYNGLVADGVDLSVARPGQGSVVITETGGGSAVYEGGCFALAITVPCPRCPPVPSLDSYTVHLASSARLLHRRRGCAAGLRHRLGGVPAGLGAPEHRAARIRTARRTARRPDDGDTFLVNASRRACRPEPARPLPPDAR